MAVSNAEIAGLIAAAEGTATAFDYFTKQNGRYIDRSDVTTDIERRIASCSRAVQACLTHMVSMNRSNIRTCIQIVQLIVQRLRSLQRMRPEGDLEHILILEDIFYEERLSEMYANQADIQVKENMLQRLMDEDGFDPADWWKPI